MGSVETKAYTLLTPNDYEGWQYIGQYIDGTNNRCYYIRGTNNVQIEYNVRLYNWYSSTNQIQNPTVWGEILLVDTPQGIKPIKDIYGSNFEVGFNDVNINDVLNYPVNLYMVNDIYHIENLGVYNGSGNLYRCNANAPDWGASVSGLYNYIVSGTSGNNLEFITEALNQDTFLNNGNAPSDPVYSYDENIGSLVNVEFKNVIDETGEANFLDISYSRYTSTGRDLSSSGYGIMSRLVYNDPNNLDSIISFPEFLRPNINDSTGKKALKLITWGSALYGNAIADSIADLFSGNNFDSYNFDNPSGGGGHSFEFSQMDPYYDVILTPYFFDGTDYYYGDNTVINGVYFDQMGTRLIDDPDSDQTISITNVTINNYDYGIESQYINNGEITNIDSLQVYNYTTYVTDNSQTNIDNSINTTNISTTNIYNSDNNYRPFGNKNIFNGVTVSDILNGLQSVITAFAMAFPILGGLFDYLPWWAVDIASTCTVVLAAFAVLKVLKLGGTHVSNISS